MKYLRERAKQSVAIGLGFFADCCIDPTISYVDSWFNATCMYIYRRMFNRKKEI